MQWADYLERVAYNALPTQVTDDYSARQYYQQTNQIAVTREWREFSTPHDDTDLLFGELTGYPCCTSNLHQGWPKFVQNLWYATADNGLASLLFAPSQVTARVAGGIEVNLKEETAILRGDSTLPCFVYGQESEKGLLPLPPAHTGLVQATGGQAQRQTADGRCLSRNRHTYQPGMERGRYPIPRTADGGDRQPLV